MLAAASTILLLVVVCLCHGKTTQRKCRNDDVDFAAKVDQSSVVVYGKTMAKMMDDVNDTTFHIFFQVDCILKGPAIARKINITVVGKKEGKHYCHEFDVGRGYSIAFLERDPAHENDTKSFVPADFVEILDEGNSTSELLARTCNLHRLVPLQSVATVTEICPAVATDAHCLDGNMTTSFKTQSELEKTSKNLELTTTKVLVAADKSHLTHPINTPQQELDAIRPKSTSVDVADVEQRNVANSITTSLLILMAIFFVRFH